MNIRWQVAFWLGALAFSAATLWLLRDVLLPFVAGMALAYLLDPPVKRLEHAGLNRLIATLLVVAVFIVAFVLLVILVVPILAAQLTAFIENLPGYIVRLRGLLTDPSRPWLRRIIGEGFRDADINDLVGQSAAYLVALLRSLWSGGQTLLSIFSLVVVTPVVAFYLLYDWDRMVAKVDSWVPRPHRNTVRALGREINLAVIGFVRGQIAVCLILGSFYAVALSLVGLNFGLLIGIITGGVSFIPYVGSLTGLVLSVGVAVAQFWPDWALILAVVAIFLVGQFFEGYVLAPKLVGESIGLHPVWLMFAIFVFAYLFGFVGMLLAVPLAAAVGVLARFALRQYLESPLYRGGEKGS
jgi:predicted PurR-regulated permease PerM